MATTETNLWRAVRKEEFPDGPVVNEKAVGGVLYPTLAPFPYKVKIGKREETRIRRPDVSLRLIDGITMSKPAAEPLYSTRVASLVRHIGTISKSPKAP